MSLIQAFSAGDPAFGPAKGVAWHIDHHIEMLSIPTFRSRQEYQAQRIVDCEQSISREEPKVADLMAYKNAVSVVSEAYPRMDMSLHPPLRGLLSPH